MVLDKTRGAVDWLIVPAARRCRNVDPNTITWTALPISLAAGVLFYFSHPARTEHAPFLLFGALVLIGVTSFLDLLDGKVATMFQKSSRKGDYLDHALDRFADVAFIGGVALSGWVDLRVGFVAMTAVLMVSYLGTQAQAVGIERNYGGILGRADRLAILSIATVIDVVRLVTGWQVPAWLPVSSALELMMWYFAVAGVITVVQRFHQGLHGFD